jgi:hypothetical protein
MSVRAGREFLAIPGPTTIPDKVLRAMHRPAVDIYSGPLLALTDGLMRDVARRVQKPKAAPTFISPMATAPGRPLSPMFSRGGTFATRNVGLSWATASASSPARRSASPIRGTSTRRWS